MNLRGRYSVEDFERLTSLDRDFNEEEKNKFENYNTDFSDMEKYEDFLLPSLRIELMKYRESINNWSMQENAGTHKKEALDAYEKSISIQKQLGYEHVKQLVLKKDKRDDSFGFSSVVQILAITIAGISVLVFMTLILI